MWDSRAKRDCPRYRYFAFFNRFMTVFQKELVQVDLYCAHFGTIAAK